MGHSLSTIPAASGWEPTWNFVSALYLERYQPPVAAPASELSFPKVPQNFDSPSCAAPPVSNGPTLASIWIWSSVPSAWRDIRKFAWTVPKKTYSASNRSRLSGNFFHMTHLLKRCLACLSNNGWFYFVNESFICLRLGEEHFSLLIDLLRVCRHR